MIVSTIRADREPGACRSRSLLCSQTRSARNLIAINVHVFLSGTEYLHSIKSNFSLYNFTKSFIFITLLMLRLLGLTFPWVSSDLSMTYFRLGSKIALHGKRLSLEYQT